MTAQDIIYRFVSRAYFDGHVVVHEADAMYKPDIATITRDLKINEYEIKVSAQDLRKELDYIEFVIRDQQQGIDPFFDTFTDMRVPHEQRQEQMRLWRESEPKKYRRSDNKYRKHLHYLYNKTPDYGGGSRVNRFYFLIPKELYELEKARLDAVPMYGVVDAQSFYSLKRCRQLHKDEADARTVWQAALNLSHKVIYKEPLIEENPNVTD